MSIGGLVVWLGGNLLLAAIPVVLAFGIVRGVTREQSQVVRPINWLVWGPLLLVWLVFLPNTCYLLTEWRHFLDSVTAHPDFYAIYHTGQYPAGPSLELLLLVLFYSLYSGAGLLALFASVRPLDRLARRYWGTSLRWCRAAVFALCSAGVYLGLVHRVNSWDLIRLNALEDIGRLLVGVVTHPLLLGVVLAFGAFLWLLYTLFDIWMDGAAQRWGTVPKEADRHASS